MFAGFAVLLILVTLFIQLLFCFREKRKTVRLLPIFLLIGAEFLCVAVYIICIMLEQSGKGIYGAAFAAFIYGFGLLAALAGATTAWLIWGIVKLVQNRRK